MPDPLFDSLNAAYAQDLYERYSRNPESVPEAWRKVFADLVGGPDASPFSSGAPPYNGAGGSPPPLATAPPVSAPQRSKPAVVPASAPASDEAPAVARDSSAERALLSLVARATSFVQAFRDHGSKLARIDPLGSDPPGHPQLDPAFFGTSMEELERIPASVVFGEESRESLAAALRRLQSVYCESTGFHFEHLEDPVKVQWLWRAVESGEHARPLSRDARVRLLGRLAEVEGFEQFLHRAYLGQKRFSIEGTDMLVPMLDLALELGVKDGAREVVLGMAHRGRLNVLTHILGVPYEEMIAAFEGKQTKNGNLTQPDPGTGDVKYHHGARGSKTVGEGRSVGIRLAPNPSHLEFVNPVVEGLARVLQFSGPEADAVQRVEAVIPILIHGDAAFAAEGVVAETLNLARLAGYRTGGTIHVILNNQVGFTTDPRDGRSTHYSSDLAKGYDIPIIHVNADDPEACLSAVRVAMAYRAQFHDDILIELVGYRRHGHNEGDEPAYTQPELVKAIAAHPTVLTQWEQTLVGSGSVTAEEAEAIRTEVNDRLRAAQDASRAWTSEEPPPQPAPKAVEPPDTAVDLPALQGLNTALLSVPEGFEVHPKLLRQLSRRSGELEDGTELDWAWAESLAFGSLLAEGVPVRLTGQDSQRGTFSQRHLVLHDVSNGQRHVPLASVGPARFEVFNSPLTETAVVGFEYGYSVGAHRDLVLWEAQFGDFVNVAQVILDQFIASGRAKWGQRARLVLLLPHGYEGQGPEHSSARLERFLQLCAEDNLRVAYPTTPAQYFHLLRRQALLDEERPLIVMTPKSLLRLPAAASKASELASGRFEPVLDDPSIADWKGVRRLVLVSGKFYYDLIGSASRPSDVAIARVEELYPFPARPLSQLLERYPSLEDVVWAQEEPRNMGGLSYVGPRLRVVVPRSVPLRHVARPERASPAEGKAEHHAAVQSELVREAFTILQRA